MGVGRPRRLLGWLLAFAAVASPLLIRNVVAFGNPLHNPHSAYLWLDRWEDSYRPDVLREPPTALSYLRRHGAAGAMDRFGRGVRGVMRLAVREVLAPFGLPPALASALGAATLVLAAAGVVLDPDRCRAVFTLAAFAAFGGAFAWFYDVTPASRFIMVMGPIAQLYAAVVVMGLARWALASLRVRDDRCATLIAACVGLIVFACLVGVNIRLRSLRANPLQVVRLAPGFEELRDWLSKHVREAEPYAHGPSHRYQFEWNTRPPLRATPLPLLKDRGELRAWLKEQGIRFLVVDAETALRRRDLLGGVVASPRRLDEPIRVVGVPPGWRIAATGPTSGAAYVVFDVSAGPT
jgi:hypothetical protein